MILLTTLEISSLKFEDKNLFAVDDYPVKFRE